MIALIRWYFLLRKTKGFLYVAKLIFKTYKDRKQWKKDSTVDTIED